MAICQSVIDMAPVAPTGHQFALAQHAQLMTDGGLLHLDEPDDLVDAELAFCERGHDAQTIRIRQRLEEPCRTRRAVRGEKLGGCRHICMNI